MNRWRWGFLSCTVALCWLAGSASDVGAEGTITPTVTTTPAPLFLTPTPVSVYPGLLPCPEGNPVGWGIVTPSPRWLQLCAHCVDYTEVYSTVEVATPGVYPTATPAAWVTPLATSVYSDAWSSTVTPGATETVMPTPAATPVPGGMLITSEQIGGYTIPEGEWQYTSGAGSRELDFWGDVPGDGYAYCYDVEYGGSAQGTYTSWSFWRALSGVRLRWQTNAIHTGNIWVRWDDTGGAGSTGGYVTSSGSHNICTVIYPSGSTLDCEFEGVARVCSNDNWSARPSLFVLEFMDPAYWAGSAVLSMRWITATGEFVGLATPTPEPTGTPAPTATAVPDDDYCWEVEGIEGDGLGIELPGFTVGAGRCYGIDEISVNLPIVGEWSVPFLEVCFERLEFGELNLFGVIVDMDVLAAVAAGVVTLRWLLRS